MTSRELGLDGSLPRELLDQFFDGVYAVDAQLRIRYWNPSAERITGYLASEVVGRQCAHSLLVHVDDRGSCLCDSTGCPLGSAISSAKNQEARLYLRHRDGYRLPVQMRALPIRTGELSGGAIEIFRERTDRTNTEELIRELREVALVDVLTGLPNRRYLDRTLNARLEEMRRFERSFGVLFIDVDNFKSVNDAHGHEIGDDVLRMVAQTLSSCMRRSDSVGRWGGEEFIAVISDLGADSLPSVARKVRSLVASSKLTTAQGPIQVTVSVGGTVSQPDDDIESLLQRADTLMYESKQAGKNRITLDPPAEIHA